MFKLVCYVVLGLSLANVEVFDNFLHASEDHVVLVEVHALAAVILAHVIGHGVKLHINPHAI